VASQIIAYLAQKGAGIGSMDALIASHALSRGFILVTNNRRHHSRVPGLVLDTWTKG
jgi:tRNA(fMet)-specific endonuclease VapC